MSEYDVQQMRECFRLALQGAGSVSPNPLVGCVIVSNDTILATGYHKKFGEAHAEVNAIHHANSLVEGATVYVNLEPCNYTGKTPPCTDLLIRSKVKRVVVGMKDPNPRVSGKGIKQLQEAGIEVTFGVLEDEAKKLNEFFIKYIRTKIPFVTLKVAQTLDGKIADKNGNSKWITGKDSRQYVHQLRASYDAILVGARTVADDNPLLTVREVEGRNPVRIIVDGNFTSKEDAKVFNDKAARTMLFISSKRTRKQIEKKLKLEQKGIEIFEMPDPVPGYMQLEGILKQLGKENIASVLVEGGATTFSHVIEQKQADKILVFIAPKIIGSGLDAFEHLQGKLLGNEISLNNISFRQFQQDVLIEGYF